MRYEFIALAGLAAAAPAPGGALPAGLEFPSTVGFMNATVHPSKGGGAICVSGIVPVSASTSKNLKLNYTLPANQSQVTETFLEYITPGSPLTKQIMGGTQNISGVYNIASTMCIPGTGINGSSVQLLTHGIGADRYYWDFAPGYSYADVAAEHGYTTFFYDRLGVGLSSKPDAINVTQGPLEVEIANNLAKLLRNGTFANTTFKSVIGTGHSFGSLITNSVTANYPKSLDAAVLTGYSMDSTGMAAFTMGLNLAIASENQPYRFSGLSNGYLVANNIISNQIGFFKSPGFDPSILSMADATKGSVTVGELLGLSSIGGPAMNFTGPITVVNGAEDLPFCFGNCTYQTNKAAAVKPALYPMAKNTSSYYLAPNAGHGLNWHYSAADAFEFIQNFVSSNGF